MSARDELHRTRKGVDTRTPSMLRAHAAALEALAASLRADADAIDARAVEAPENASALNLAQLRERYGFSRESLRAAAREGLPVLRGPKGRLLAFEADVVEWLRARPWSPTARTTPTADAFEDINRRIAAELGLT